MYILLIRIINDIDIDIDFIFSYVLLLFLIYLYASINRIFYIRYISIYCSKSSLKNILC